MFAEVPVVHVKPRAALQFLDFSRGCNFMASTVLWEAYFAVHLRVKELSSVSGSLAVNVTASLP